MDRPRAPAPPHAGFGDELRVDWLPATDLADGRAGNIGMTVLPGKRGRSQRYPGHVYRRDLEADIHQLRTAGVNRLVLLVDDAELARWSDPAFAERARAVGMEVRRHPMADGAAPASMEAMDAILADIDEARIVGHVAVACMGGVGRTGTVVACALVRAGLPAGAAIRRVRILRHPTAVETAEQERFVRAYAASRSGARP